MDIERRRHKRSELKVNIQMIRLDGVEKDRQSTVPIEIFDLSMDGIGFKTDVELQLGSLYNVVFYIWTKETLNTVIKLVRKHEKEDSYTYGASFVGMTDAEKFRVEVYQLFENHESGTY